MIYLDEMKRQVFGYIVFLLLAFIPSLWSSTIPDSVEVIAPDSVSEIKKSSGSDLKGPVHYKADTILFSVDRRYTYLIGNAEISYTNMTLKASSITVDWNNSSLFATARMDSVDSLGNPVFSGIPTFTEKGSEPMMGIEMTYNFRTRRGTVLEGKTKMEPGYYRGSRIKKIGDKTILVRNASFTSCDLPDHPHFYFHTDKAWVTMNEKLAGKPVVLYIADIPVFYLPGIFLSLKRDRHSGIIFPKYGISAYGGRYLKDFGFYWAINDYMDATLLSSFYDRRGFVFSGSFNYKLRYRLDGNVSAQYSPRDLITGAKRQEYRINFRHNQTISETANLNAGGSFVSSKNFINQVDNLELIYNQNLITTVNFTQRLPGLNSSINIGLNRSENLQTGNVSQTFPRVSFSLPSRSLGGKNSQGLLGTLRYNYSTNLESQYTKTRTISGADTGYTTVTRSRWDHQINLSSSFRLLRFFNLSPSVNWKELWVPEYRDYYLNPVTGNIEYRKKKGFKARHTYSASLNFRTTLYGLFEIPFGPLKYIRHKMDPSVSFQYTPDFSARSFGYFEEIADTSGNVVKKDIFEDYGQTPLSRSQSLNFSLSNFFQGKMIRDGKEKKIDLFSWNLSTSYNMLADSLKWNDIFSSVSTSLGKGLQLNGSMVHSLYEAGTSGSGRRNRWYASSHTVPLRFVRANASFGFTISSDMFKAKEEDKKEPASPESTADDELEQNQWQNVGGISFLINENRLDQIRQTDVSWNFAFRFAYTYDRSNILQPRKTFTTNINSTIVPTKNWKVNLRTDLNVIRKTINYMEFLIYRDLHCWEMNFTWRPLPYSFYMFEIRVKASMLRDIKYDKRSRSSRAFY